MVRLGKVLERLVAVLGMIEGGNETRRGTASSLTRSTVERRERDFAPPSCDTWATRPWPRWEGRGRGGEGPVAAPDAAAVAGRGGGARESG